MRHAITKSLAATALVLLGLPGLLMAQQHGHEHGDRDGPMRGMMQHAMEDCPMAAGMMEAVLQHAEELELTEDQIARFEELRERLEDGHPAMREVMRAVHEILTPEQMETMRETFHGHVAGMMRMMRGEGHGMHGEGHRMHEGRMGAHAEECPMMRRGTGEDHRHPR